MKVKIMESSPQNVQFQVIFHPEYDLERWSRGHDLALVKLSRLGPEVRSSPKKPNKPVTLPGKNFELKPPLYTARFGVQAIV